jgi:4-hydroxy-3-polyprenylbenzoate decarboxylase
MAPGSTERRRAIAIAVTGASGAVYATRTLAALLERGVHVELIVSDYGRRLLRDELGEQASGRSADAVPGRQVRRGRRRRDADAAQQPRSRRHDRQRQPRLRGMAIVPCSMKTLAAVAHGLSRNPDRARRRRDAQGKRRLSSCRARRR